MSSLIRKLNTWQPAHEIREHIVFQRFLFRYWHRSLNPKKLIDVKFSHLSSKMTMARTIKLYKLPEVSAYFGLLFGYKWPPMFPETYRSAPWYSLSEPGNPRLAPAREEGHSICVEVVVRVLEAILVSSSVHEERVWACIHAYWWRCLHLCSWGTATEVMDEVV